MCSSSLVMFVNFAMFGSQASLLLHWSMFCNEATARAQWVYDRIWQKQLLLSLALFFTKRHTQIGRCRRRPPENNKMYWGQRFNNNASCSPKGVLVLPFKRRSDGFVSVLEEQNARPFRALDARCTQNGEQWVLWRGSEGNPFLKCFCCFAVRIKVEWERRSLKRRPLLRFRIPIREKEERTKENLEQKQHEPLRCGVSFFFFFFFREWTKRQPWKRLGINCVFAGFFPSSVRIYIREGEKRVKITNETAASADDGYSTAFLFFPFLPTTNVM